MPAAFFLNSSFLQAINAVMPWPVHVQKVPQASERLCPAKLQTRCSSSSSAFDMMVALTRSFLP